MRDIKAAMTPGAWIHKEFMVGPIGPGDKLFGFIHDETGALHIGWNGEPLRPVTDTAPLAALALYGQPFGFTQAMANELEWIAGELDTLLPGVDDEPSAAAESLREIQARIAALLPPEG